MRPNRNIRLGLALIALALILLGLSAIVRRMRPAPQPAMPPVQNDVPVETVSRQNSRLAAYAREDIPERAIVTANMLEMKPISDGAVGTYVRDIENNAVGFITNRPIRRGVALQTNYLLGHISDVGIAGALLPGRRAMIIPLGTKATLHDLVRIGDRVDVVAAFDQQESRTIVQDVRVLAVDVFGKDFPPVKVAMRGDYKASPRSVSVANPPSPNGAPGGQPGQAPGNGQQAAPTPTPQPTPPATKPESAITLEVTPEQATAISLAQASNANIDFLIRPSTEAILASTGAATTPGATGAEAPEEARVATTIRPVLAPYAERVKRGSSNKAGSNSSTRAASSGDGGSRSSGRRSVNYSPFPMPDSGPAMTAPMPVPATPQVQAPQTYDIPIYGDGKLVRTDTVRKPQD